MKSLSLTMSSEPAERVAYSAQMFSDHARAGKPEQVDIGLFRQAFRQLAGGVSVITMGRGLVRTGMTVTSVTSFSADPPTLLFCANRNSSSFPVLEQMRSFAVNILDANQRTVADRFAGVGGIKGHHRYAGAEWSTLETGVPVLTDALATLDCEVEELVLRHSHAIVIGRVRAIRVKPHGSALLYWRGDYDSIGWTTAELDEAAGRRSKRQR